jgi:hypothetical protein
LNENPDPSPERQSVVCGDDRAWAAIQNVETMFMLAPDRTAAKMLTKPFKYSGSSVIFSQSQSYDRHSAHISAVSRLNNHQLKKLSKN